MGRLMSIHLDRDRPLWETWLVEGLEGGRWALVFKVHHCMVDGIAGVELLTVLLDAAPDPDVAEPAPWSPRPEPPGALEGGRRLGRPRRRRHRRAAPPGARRHATPARPSGRRRSRRVAWAAFVGNLGTTPHVSIEGTIGAHRSWAHSCAELSRREASSATPSAAP